MKKYIKMFEEFLTEEDPLAALTGGGNEEPKEDPLDKEKKKQKKAEEKADKKHDKMIEDRLSTVKELLHKHLDLPKGLEERVIDAIKSEDRVKIHNAANDLIYQQQKYQENGDMEGVDDITRVKEIVDDLDKSFTSDKRM